MLYRLSFLFPFLLLFSIYNAISTHNRVGQVAQDFHTQDESLFISGTIIDSVDSTPIEKVSITATSTENSYTVNTDQVGFYDFPDLPAGNYLVTPGLVEYDFSPINQAITIDTTGQASVNFTGTRRTYTISGTVLEGSQPLYGVTIDDGIGQTTTTISDGSYQFVGLYAGTYTMTATKPGFVFSAPQLVTLPPNQSGIDFTGNPLFSLSGHIQVSQALPVADVTITLMPGGLTTKTDNNGDYHFDDLLAGSYTLSASKSSYSFNPLNQTVNLVGNTAGIDFTAIPLYNFSGHIQINSITPLSGVTITLSPGGETTLTNSNGNYQFTGLSVGYYTLTPSKIGYKFNPSNPTIHLTSNQVVNFTGIPIYDAGGRVQVNPSTPLSGVTVTISPGGQTIITDSSGNYKFYGLATGDYTFTPQKSGYIFAPNVRDVNLDSTNNSIDFTAVPVYSISGTILDILGNPVANASVTTSGYGTTTDINGLYQLPMLLEGSYVVTVSKVGFSFTPPQNITLPPSKTNVNFIGTPIFDITGFVGMDTQTPIEGVTITLSPGGRTTTTGTDGIYHFNGLPSNNYTLIPAKAEYQFSPSSQYIVLNGSKGDIDFTAVQQEYTISGNVWKNDNSPLPGVIFRISPGNVTILTGADGAYTIPDLAAGDYTITPTLSDYQFVPTNRIVHVGPGKVSQDFIGTAILYSVSGTIIDGKGNPLQGVMVSAGNSDTTSTDDQGWYHFDNLLAGDYLITPHLERYSFSPSSLTIHVGPNQTNINFAGQPFTFSVNGKVKNNQAMGIPDLSICTNGSCVLSDLSGSYTISGLISGKYIFTASKEEFDCLPSFLELQVDQNITDKNFICNQRTYSITGKVFYKQEPYEGVSISIGVNQSVTTNSDGIFTFNNLLSGNYTLVPSKSGIQFSPVSTEVHVGPSSENVNFTRLDFYNFLPSVTTGLPDKTIFFDDFTTDNPGWQPILSSGGQAGITNGEYRLYQTQSSQFLAAIAPLTSGQIGLTGYSLESSIKILQGLDSKAGVVFDWIDTTSFQLFVIKPSSQEYWVYKYEQGLYHIILSGSTLAINSGSGAVNKIKLTRQKGDVSVYINGVLIGGSVQDPMPNNGRVGLQLLVYRSVPAESSYDNFKVSGLP